MDFHPAGWGCIFTTGLTIMGSHTFGFLGARQFFIFTDSKRTRMFELQIKGAMSHNMHARAHENKLEKDGLIFSSCVGDFGRLFLSV